jgi:hypothetical protein
MNETKPYFKVKDLIKELKKMDQESLALFAFHAQIGEKVLCGYVPYNKLTTKKVILKSKDNWYVESKSSKAKEIVVIDYV